MNLYTCEQCKQCIKYVDTGGEQDNTVECAVRDYEKVRPREIIWLHAFSDNHARSEKRHAYCMAHGIFSGIFFGEAFTNERVVVFVQ